MRTSTKLFIFAAGVAFGTAVTWFSAKRYWEQAANDEIESMKEWLARRVEEQNKAAEEKISDPAATVKPASPSDKPDLKSYVSMVNKLGYGYTDYSRTHSEENHPTEKEEVDEWMEDKVYIIKPEIFGEEDGYEEVSLTYYADGVLCDEQDNVIEDVTSMVVPDFADYFGYYEDDAVYVRNELLKTDYEILADSRDYADLYHNTSHLPEDE